MTTTYTDLFEDEVSEILRELKHGSIITLNEHHQFSLPGMINEDGISSTDENMYTEFINGKQTGYVNRNYLLYKLSHETFTICEE